MNDPFVTFDTFTVGSSIDGPMDTPASAQDQLPPIFARLPRVATPPKRETKQRFDEAETVVLGTHLAESGADLSMGMEAATPITLACPTATIRIDTVDPQYFDEPAPRQAAAPAAPAATPSVEEPLAEPIDDPWADWLLNLESTVLPYSKVIVLAAVIAALGLTLVLVGGSRTPIEAPSGAPQVQLDEVGPSFAAADEAASGAEMQTAAAWPAPTLAAEATGLRRLDATQAATPPTLAAGPASAARATGRAMLTGEVHLSDPVRVDVATATGATTYPQTK